MWPTEMSLSSSVPETLVQCHRLVAAAATAGTGRWSVSPCHSGSRRWVPVCIDVWWSPGRSGTNTQTLSTDRRIHVAQGGCGCFLEVCYNLCRLLECLLTIIIHSFQHYSHVTANYMYVKYVMFRYTHTHDVPAFSSPAFSSHAIWSHVFQSRVFHSRVFSRPVQTRIWTYERFGQPENTTATPALQHSIIWAWSPTKMWNSNDKVWSPKWENEEFNFVKIWNLRKNIHLSLKMSSASMGLRPPNPLPGSSLRLPPGLRLWTHGDFRLPDPLFCGVQKSLNYTMPSSESVGDYKNVVRGKFVS